MYRIRKRRAVLLGFLGLFALFTPALVGCGTPPPASAWHPDEDDPVSVAEVEGQPAGNLPTRPRESYWWNLPKDQRPRIVGGQYRSRLDSLSFDAYRALPQQEQLDRRDAARQTMRQAKEQRDPRVAQHYYATATGVCPYLPQAWDAYARTQLEIGRYPSARAFVECAERTLRFAGNEGDQNEVGADIYRTDAFAAYNLGQLEDALHSAELSLSFHGDDEVDLLRARALIDLAHYERAQIILDRFRFTNPYWSHSRAIYALLEMDRGDLDQADALFREAHEYGMRGAIFEYDRGRLRLLQDRPDDAIGHFRKAIATNPNLMEARNNLAVALRRSGKDDEAKRALEDAIAVDRNYAPAYFNLAEIYADEVEGLQGREQGAALAEARKYYGLALEHGYLRRTVLERRAIVAYRAGDVVAAEADLLELAGSPETEGRVLFLLARAKQDQSEYRIAEDLYRMALDKGYVTAEVHSGLGEVLLLQSDPAGAREHLEAAIDADSTLVATRINLSVALSQLGDLAAAERALQGAEALAPNDPMVQSQRADLEQLKRGG